MAATQTADNPPARPAATDPRWFRKVLSNYPTGVTVITAIGADGTADGMVVGSFTSVSLDPPLVAFLPSTTSNTWARIRATRRFCVNILGADHERLCRQFAAKGGDKFHGVAWHMTAGGSAVIDDAVAWIDCITDRVHRAGDHDIVIGRVLDLDTAADGLPLLFYQGGYGSFTPHTLVAAGEHFTTELELIDLARPLLEGTARSIRSQIAVAHCDGTTLTVLATAGHSNNHHIPNTAIGQSVNLTAPIGIWWMAYAPPATVQPWLSAISDPQRRQQLRTAMRQIRADGGLTVGLRPVHSGLDKLLADRIAGRPHNAADEPALPSELTWQPHNFVASRFTDGATTTEHPGVRSIWHPVLDNTGRVLLGVMATGLAADQPLTEVTRAIQHLARSIASLNCRSAATGHLPVAHDPSGATA